ncbi:MULTISPECIES: hypothetical protein [unclassified Pseudomonas]|uniref:hypothetical protein n=1 Tax=unclassified Pseudomonas TaxID=196821 RepID=UPI003859C4C9
MSRIKGNGASPRDNCALDMATIYGKVRRILQNIHLTRSTRSLCPGQNGGQVLAEILFV